MSDPQAEKPLTANIRAGQEPPDLHAYEQGGGYQSLRKALKMSPRDVQDLVTKSNLRGRGGAGFPAGKKWSFMPLGKDSPQPKYFVVNADEMEPGTFKDRLLLEGDPHQMVESLIISAYAVEAGETYIFLRQEYTLAARRLAKAIAEAQAAGYLGENILGSGYHCRMHLHSSAGRYMCGEETGLLNALEGRRATPRSKPPHPQVSGLWGRPTIVNNVETVCCVRHIVQRGAEWFRKLSRSDGGVSGGTKIYGVSGRVKRPGLWELPIGTTLGEILHEHAGGMRDGFALRGALPGGASTDFLTAEHLDAKMDFGLLEKFGSRLGTGTIIVLDDRTCPVGMVLNLMTFFAHESCGWCTPCREGLPWIAKILNAIERGEGQAGDLEILREHTHLLGLGHTFCALAPGAMEPLQSALKHFGDDFQKHLDLKRCPYKT